MYWTVAVSSPHEASNSDIEINKAQPCCPLENLVVGARGRWLNQQPHTHKPWAITGEVPALDGVD